MRPKAYAVWNGTQWTFHDYQSGARLSDNYEGVVRLFLAGVIDAVVKTYIEDGKRQWKGAGLL